MMKWKRFVCLFLSFNIAFTGCHSTFMTSRSKEGDKKGKSSKWKKRIQQGERKRKETKLKVYIVYNLFWGKSSYQIARKGQIVDVGRFGGVPYRVGEEDEILVSQEGRIIRINGKVHGIRLEGLSEREAEKLIRKHGKVARLFILDVMNLKPDILKEMKEVTSKQLMITVNGKGASDENIGELKYLGDRLVALSLNNSTCGTSCEAAIGAMERLRFFRLSYVKLKGGISNILFKRELDTLSLSSIKTKGEGMGPNCFNAKIHRYYGEGEVDFIKCLNSLEVLFLGEYGTPDEKKEFIKLVRKKKDLNFLHIGGLEKIWPFEKHFFGFTLHNTSFCIDELQRALAGGESLRTLSLRFTDCRVNSKVFPKGLPNLEVLALNGNPKPEKNWNFLKKSRSLKYLDLDWSGIGDRDIEQLSKKGLLQKLRVVQLEKTKITDQSIQYIRKAKNLRELSVCNTRLSVKAIEEIVKMKNLIILDLSQTRIVGSILERIAKMKWLRSLKLESTGLTDTQLNILGRMKHLKSIEIMGNQISKKGIEILKKELGKDCNVMEN